MKKITYLLAFLIFSLGYSQQQQYLLDFEPGDPDGNLATWVTFESPAPGAEILTNPDPDGTNTSTTTQVMKLTLAQGAACYSGMINLHNTLGTWQLDPGVASNLTLSMDVNNSIIGKVGIKMANTTDGTLFEIKDNQGVNTVANEWQTLTWDISAGANSPENTTVDQIVVFIDWRCTGEAPRPSDVTLLVDNITWGANKLSDPPAPTCSDGVKNGDEEGVDCGGSACSPCSGPVSIDFDASQTYVGYANIFELPENGGAYVTGFEYGVPDMKTTLDPTNNIVTLQPNFKAYADNPNDSFWVNQTTLEGAKTFEGNTYVQNDALAGSVVTFTGAVTSNTLDAAYEGIAFIKVFVNDFSSSKIVSAPLNEGVFSITYDNVEASDAHVQYGFAITGQNANPDDEAALGSIVVTSVALSSEDVSISDFKYYPNPSNTQWTIKTNTTIMQSVQITNMLGKKVMDLKVNSNEVNISSDRLATGLYFANIKTENGSAVLKLIKN